MKKTLCLIILLAICTTMLAGCSKKETENENGIRYDEEYYNSFDYSNRLTDDGTFTDVRALYYVTLCDYKGMVIPYSVSNVTDEDVQSEIDTMLSQYAEDEHITDRACTVGDTVNITYSATIDGESFDGSVSGDDGIDVIIGEDDSLPGFTGQINGHTPGDSFDVTVTYPEDYESMAEGEFTVNGKEAIFAVTLNYIVGEKNVLPELTDTFVTEHFASQYKWNTVYGMKNGIKEILYNQAVSNYIQTTLLSDCKVSSVPEELYIYQAENMIKYYSKAAANNEMTFDTYLGMTMQEAVEKYEESNRKQAKRSLILQAIYESCGEIKITDDEISAFFAEYYPDVDIDAFKSTYGIGYIKMVTMNQAVLDYITENAIYEETAE